MGKGLAYDEYLGKEFAKPDIERLGLFVEGPYSNGKGYVFRKEQFLKGPPFTSVGRHNKDGTTVGYFDTEFKRLFRGEAYRRFKRGPPPPNPPFINGFKGQKHSTPGDYYGTFGKVPAFSNVKKPAPPRKSDGVNFLSSNVKKGGPGYANICINKYPEHFPDLYNAKPKEKVYGKILAGPYVPVHYPQPFIHKNPNREGPEIKKGPTYIKKKEKISEPIGGLFMPTGPCKWQGGCHAGTFEKYPEFKPCPYVSSLQANKPFITDKDNSVFMPTPTQDKTMFSKSIMYAITDLRMNTNNCKTYEPNYNQYLLTKNDLI